MARFAVVRVPGGIAEVFDNEEEAIIHADILKVGGNRVILSKIEITPNDFEKREIFQEISNEYLFEDAERQLYTYFGISEGSDEDPEIREEFRERYGCTIEELCAPKVGFLQRIVEYFKNEQDCNVADNIIWENGIKTVLSEWKQDNPV